MQRLTAGIVEPPTFPWFCKRCGERSAYASVVTVDNMELGEGVGDYFEWRCRKCRYVFYEPVAGDASEEETEEMEENENALRRLEEDSEEETDSCAEV